MRLFRKRPAAEAGRRLYAACVAQARQPALYMDLAVPDTVEGRFELYSLHVILVLDRLVRQGDEAAEVSQGLFDAYVRSLDDALREMGVGDLSVGKKMRRIGEALYGRLRNYEAAFQGEADADPLHVILARTVYQGVTDPPVAALSEYVVAQRSHLAARPLRGILDGALEWAGS
ncbi:MAG: ubiquinol-cytochrome C chaperone family protein [Phenylobacterium sp.]